MPFATHMILNEGLYRLQVASLGNGGGGEFRLSLAEFKELQIGERGAGTVQPGAMDFWSFAGQEGKTVFLSVRSSAFLDFVESWGGGICRAAHRWRLTRCGSYPGSRFKTAHRLIDRPSSAPWRVCERPM